MQSCDIVSVLSRGCKLLEDYKWWPQSPLVFTEYIGTASYNTRLCTILIYKHTHTYTCHYTRTIDINTNIYIKKEHTNTCTHRTVLTVIW